jgi:hypothetical protein
LQHSQDGDFAASAFLRRVERMRKQVAGFSENTLGLVVGKFSVHGQLAGQLSVSPPGLGRGLGRRCGFGFDFGIDFSFRLPGRFKSYRVAKPFVFST